MTPHRSAAREISYASSAHSRAGRAVIGRPLARESPAALAGDARAMMDLLRAETYRLSPRPILDLRYGFEFEDAR